MILQMNPEQRGIGMEDVTTEEMKVNINGKIITKTKTTYNFSNEVYYYIGVPYPDSYQNQFLIFFSYRETEEELMNTFDQIIASIEFTRD